MGLIQALTNVYETATLVGCHFHFTQALHRHLSSALKKEFKENNEFTMLIRKLFSLPYVHRDDIFRAFNAIKFSTPAKFHPQQNSRLHQDLTDFFDYVRKTYVGGQYQSPLYPHAFWNLHARVLNRIPRTNNSVEGWNNRIQVLAEASHLSLHRFLNVIIDELLEINHALVHDPYTLRLRDHLGPLSYVFIICSY